MNLLTFSNFIPEHISDLKRFQGFRGSRRISHYCGYAQDFIAQVFEDPEIDGALIPYSCDSSRVMADYLSSCDKFVYQLKAPVLTTDAAIDFFAETIKDMRTRLNEYFSTEITVEKILERCRIIHERNDAVKHIYDNITDFHYHEYLSALNRMLNNPLADWENHLPDNAKRTVNGKRIYVIGSFITNTDVVKQIENSGFSVAGDNLTNSKRLFSSNGIIRKTRIYQDIAANILSNVPTPTQSNFERILEHDAKEIKHKGIKGVLYICQKYCEPYDFMFKVYKEAFNNLGIPLLKVYLADSNDGIRADILENFYEII